MLYHIIGRQMSSAYQRKILQQFGLSNNEISNLEISPIDPNKDPIDGMLFLRNASGMNFFHVTCRANPNFNGSEMCVAGYVSNHCVDDEDHFMAFYKSSRGSLEISEDNENYVCGFKPLQRKLYEIVRDSETNKYICVDRTIN